MVKLVFVKAMACNQPSPRLRLMKQRSGRAVYPEGMPLALHRSCPKGIPAGKIGDPSRGTGVQIKFVKCFMHTFYKVRRLVLIITVIQKI